ncbi:hypothetical protein Trco_008430 [Trichoderma cornu-damae]|uniref:NADP-dependent oxidoreductase domain-containing protein n=1 Tax=Trichoderma cornu-damae TaxID=654480 RepID=A0A9P8QFD8_9HYPO|nr:hypothetical protein Trco_008430 [Trichoderma cornu-damae]
MAQKLTLQSVAKLNSGYQMPRLGFGVYQTSVVPHESISVAVATDVCREALQIGYRHIDSASGYRNQGPSAAGIPASGVPREDVFFTTKVPVRLKPLGYRNTLDLVDVALEETKLSYLDLVLIHAPYGGTENRNGAWRALVECVDAGKVRSIGVSNYGVHHLDELEAYIKELESERGPGKGGIISVGQWEVHPWLPRDDIVQWCRARNIVVQAYSPIVRGERWGEAKVVAIADKYGKTEAQVLLRWSLQKGFVPLIKSVTPSRIAENADLYDFELTEDEVKELTTTEYSPCAWDPTVEPLDNASVSRQQKVVTPSPANDGNKHHHQPTCNARRRHPRELLPVDPVAAAAMRIQKTFTIVPHPGPASRTPVDNRPMTSKQVRKAYRAANRVPRVSRAELLRQERAEQERIRKELDKEKAAAKAKALREKKRAKEQAEREEKKKKGLPLVAVRPSQDTIARFARGNGSGNKRDCKGKHVDGVTDAAKASTLPAVVELEEDDDDSPSPKRFCNKEQEGPGGEAGENGAAVEEPYTAPDTVLEKNAPAAEDDFLDGFEIMSDEEISTLSLSGVAAGNPAGRTEECPELGSPPGPDAIPEHGNRGHSHRETTLPESNSIVSIKNPEPIAPREFDDLLFDDEDDLELEMLALDVVMAPQQQRLAKEPAEKPLPQAPHRQARTATGYEADLGLAAGLHGGIPRAAGPARREQAALMPPPPAPAVPRPSRSHISPVATKPQAPPLSTQQILFNMDDFFPTFSQQAAELEEEETAFVSQRIKADLIPEAQAPSPVPQAGSLPADALSSSPEPPKPFFTSSGSNERMAVAFLRSRRTAEREEEQRKRTLESEAIGFEEAKRKEAERRDGEKGSADSKLQTTTADAGLFKTGAGSREKELAPRQARPVAAATPQFSTRKGLAANSNHLPRRTSVQRTPLAEANAKAAFLNAQSQSPPAAEVDKTASPHGISTRPPCRPSLGANKTPLPLEAKHRRSSPPHTRAPAKASNKENMPSPEFSETKQPAASQESEFGGSWMDELATELSL